MDIALPTSYPDSVALRRRGLALSLKVGASLSLSVMMLTAAQSAGGQTPSCFGYYRPAQFSNDNDFIGIRGYLTDPSAADVVDPGYDHLLAWDEMVEESVPSGGDSCGIDEETQCWVQVGVGQGTVGEGGTTAENSSGFWEIYYENEAANDSYSVKFDTAIEIVNGDDIDFKDYYSGHSNDDGYPEFDTWAFGLEQQWDLVSDTGFMYDSSTHVAAAAEVLVTDSDDVCPTLTDGSPYQTFGTDNGGNYDSGQYAVQLDSGGSWADWSGSPQVQGGSGDGWSQAPYYYSPINFPDAFRTNGPSSTPP